jgi:hypothetical protein
VTDEPCGRDDVVERYEQLRARALGGDSSGWRLGLAMLQRRGVVAWTRAWQATAAPPVRVAPVAPAAGSEQLVSALASMALACVSER